MRTESTTIVEFEDALYGVTVKVDDNRGSYDRSEANKKGRLYIWGEPSPDLPVPPYSIKGDDPDVDKAWGKYNAEEIRIERAFAQQVVESLGFTVSGFSRKAGCGCGCSPGFILEGAFGREVFVDVQSSLPVSRTALLQLVK